ncbi:MAG: DUF2274 domain-containing protein [Sphingomonas sp.]|jgi:hypothetical protein|uniref:DUF2274 domain-containing protein n=1 Tax=Sphingomonas sp. TaxID=28214 RepID=UPI003565B8D3
MTDIKLARLPDRIPVKVTIAVPPNLHRDLVDYAAVYKAAYGDDQPVAELIPHMLEAFLASDRGFIRGRTRS